MEAIKRANQFSLAVLLSIVMMGVMAVLGYAILTLITNASFFSKERYVYAGFILLLLPLSFTCLKFSMRCILPRSVTSSVIALWLLFWLATMPAFYELWRTAILFGYPVLYGIAFKQPLQQLLIFTFAYACCIAAVPNLIRNIFAETSRRQHFFWLMMLMLGAVLVGSQSISGLVAVGEENARWYADFEPVLYSITQVIGGKTLLVDLSAQYGLYAELLAPIVNIVGFSIFKITSLFAFMEALSFLALAIVFFQVSQSLLIRFCWIMSAILLFGFAWQNYISYGIHDPYYQYFPIRLFFPAISVFLFWKFISSKSPIRNALAFSMFLTMGVIWNLDSGIPAAGSFFAYLILAIFFTKKIARELLLKQLSMAMLGVVVTLAIFTLYLLLKSHAAISLSEWLRFQRLYYIRGLFAMPLPTIWHPWMAVIMVYMLGVLGYLRAASQASADLFWKLMLYLSVLGLGLFAYYQHRSHDVVFMAVIWPAVFIAYAGAERFIKYIVGERLPKKWLLAVLPIGMLGFAFCSFLAYKAPTMIGLALHNWRMACSQEKIPLVDNIIFMRERISRQDRNSVAIFARHQALYFGELGIASAIKGPGIAESFLPEDQDAIIEQLRITKPRVLFLQQNKTTAPVFNAEIEKKRDAIIKKEYVFVEENNQGIRYFRARR